MSVKPNYVILLPHLATILVKIPSCMRHFRRKAMPMVWTCRFWCKNCLSVNYYKSLPLESSVCGNPTLPLYRSWHLSAPFGTLKPPGKSPQIHSTEGFKGDFTPRGNVETSSRKRSREEKIVTTSSDDGAPHFPEVTSLRSMRQHMLACRMPSWFLLNQPKSDCS